MPEMDRWFHWFVVLRDKNPNGAIELWKQRIYQEG
jgi:hypothetical protein